MDREQLKCHCGCGQNDATDELFDKLNALEVKLGRQLCVTSGFRCFNWNNDPRVKGSKTSYHTTGQAADIACNVGEQAHVAALARLVGFCGIGFSTYRSFLHLDLGAVRKFAYDENGKVVPYV
jgi:zinc D-Ala-D-Ala carboxypeptidase